jgi:alkylresorcinol/alkylpyrone synthase
MSFIHSVVTATPPYRYATREIAEKAGSWLKDSPQEQALFERLANSTKIEHRNFALPIDNLLALSGSAERAQIFKKTGGDLLREVVTKALDSSCLSAHDVGALLTTSCSVPTIPAIDAQVINELGIRETVLRLPVYQYGCAGGAIGISLARHLCATSGVTLLASVELCSLVYQGGDLQAGNIVGSAIFGDGAACVVISPEEGPLRIVNSQSYLIPNSYGLMGYDIFDDGAHLRLDREIPQALLAAAPQAIDTFLEQADLSRSDIAWWLFHPGGAKILSSLEDTLSVTRTQSRWAWESLRDHGNMSSASILFALQSFIQDHEYKPRDTVLMLGVGPGLTLQMNLFECCS